MSVPLVNIISCAYNHEKYIAQALEGVLMQKTNFEFVHIIGEDASTDNTQKIIKQYQEKFPDKFHVITQKENVGAYRNSAMVFAAMNAKYVAMLDCDDYWTDPYKLQKQVDFLETNPDFAICFHKIAILNEDNPAHTEVAFTNTQPDGVYTIEDLANGNFIHTPSCMFRNHLFGKFPDWFVTCKVGDYPLHMLNAQHGKIKYLDDTMAVYRIHKGGMWGNKPLLHQLANWVQVLTILIDNFEGNIKKILIEQRNHIVTEAFLRDELLEYRNLYQENFEEIALLLKTRYTESIMREEKSIKEIYNSKTYRLGKMLTYPLNFLRKIGEK